MPEPDMVGACSQSELPMLVAVDSAAANVSKEGSAPQGFDAPLLAKARVNGKEAEGDSYNLSNP